VTTVTVVTLVTPAAAQGGVKGSNFRIAQLLFQLDIRVREQKLGGVNGFFCSLS
jgi:hypothetical protein